MSRIRKENALELETAELEAAEELAGCVLDAGAEVTLGAVPVGSLPLPSPGITGGVGGGPIGIGGGMPKIAMKNQLRVKI